MEDNKQNDLKDGAGVTPNCAPPYQYNSYPYQSANVKHTTEPLFIRSAKDVVIAVFLVLVSIFGVTEFFWNGMRLGSTIVFITFFIVSSAFIIDRKQLTVTSALYGILTAACSCTFAVTSNGSVKQAAFFICIFSTVIFFSNLSGKAVKGSDYGVLKTAVSTAVICIADIPGIFKGLFSKNGSGSKRVSRIFLGLACSIPLIMIVVPLLMRSDDAFSSMLESVASGAGETIAKIITGVIVSPIVVCLVFSLKYHGTVNNIDLGGVSVNRYTLSAFLSALSAVYLTYLFSQLAYFFSAFSNILPDGYEFTYAEYARRGFFELCIISAINLAVIISALYLCEKKSGAIPAPVRIPALFIAVFTLILIAASISKMVMYIDVYGMTFLRIGTSAFMVWMSAVFAALIVRLFAKRLDIFVTGLIAALVVVTALGVVNVNSVIAKYNYDAYKNGIRVVDTSYMASLGDEGIKYLCALADDDDKTVSENAKNELAQIIPEYYCIDYTKYDNSVPDEQDSPYVKRYAGVGTYSVSLGEAYSAMDSYITSRGYPKG